MNTLQTKKALRFGDLIAAVYDACGEHRARGIVRLAVNAHLVTFRGSRRYVISLAESQRHLAPADGHAALARTSRNA
jgi:hypothetical protein